MTFRTSRLDFIVTVDTEGDNIWAHPTKVTTENARFLPRFQGLCEEFGLRPTYLVNYEMAVDSNFQEFGRSLLRRNVGEIGLHVHAWDSPPLAQNYDNGDRDHVYLYELDDDSIHAKLSYLTKLLSSVFDIQPTSHRAGRWGFDARVARALTDLGYLVDCSITPGVNWRRYKGARDGDGGPDYFGFPRKPYYLDLTDIKKPGKSRLLEVPMTIRPNYPRGLGQFHHFIENGLGGKVVRKMLGRPNSWLRPNRANSGAEMIAVVDWALEDQHPVLEFMIHSSELMPNGSPNFTTAEHVEVLYEDLTLLFKRLASLGAVGATLSEFRSRWENGNA